jgi:putative NIF3 family GTP cyclohydrolase 1 type 2
VVAHIPTMPLQNVIAHFKKKLNIEKVRYIGDLNQTCKTTLLIPGAAGKDMHIGFMKQFKPDVLICGELSEWETAEYIRDARAMGNNIALIILGHAPSEEAGSEFMLQWLKKNYPNIPSYHIPSGSPLKFE